MTEFGWDSAPADPKGVPLQLHARWVSEALYRMWYSGVSLVTWYRLRDGPRTARSVRPVVPLRRRDRLRHAEVLLAEGVPVPLRGVPLRQGARARLGPDTGRCRREGRDRALAKGKWRKLRTLKRGLERRVSQADRGASQGQHPGASGRSGEKSVGFSLKRPPDMPVNPFGSSG